MLCRIYYCCITWYRVQIQNKKQVLQQQIMQTVRTALTRQHELDHTDRTDHTDQEYICPAWQMQIVNCSGNRLSVLSFSLAFYPRKQELRPRIRRETSLAIGGLLSPTPPYD